jgi:hypothetical protein
MSISLFMTFRDAAAERRVQSDDLATAAEMVGAIPALIEGLLFTPLEQEVAHPFAKDGPPPLFALQLRFADLFACEAAAARGSILATLAAGGGLPSLASLEVTHQAMVTRSFPVDMAAHPPGSGTPCSYLVHYPGPADDLNAWHLHYLDNHPAIMRTFPDVRQIEIYTRIDWIDRLPSQRVDYMQRNKLVFDSPEALSGALASDVIHRMRADFNQLPPFAGGNRHFPMLTRSVTPRAV